MRVFRRIMVLLLATGMLAGAVTAYADEGNSPPGPGGPGGPGGPPGGGLGGKVTEVSESSLTVLMPRGELVAVNLSSETTVHFTESKAVGTLQDVRVGVKVSIDGRGGRYGSIDARDILIIPAGDELAGMIAAVDGKSISVQTRGANGTIVIGDGTQIWTNGNASTATDLVAGKHVDAFGELQPDGSIAAGVVIVGDEAGPAGPGGAREHRPLPGGDEGQRPSGPPPPFGGEDGLRPPGPPPEPMGGAYGAPGWNR